MTATKVAAVAWMASLASAAASAAALQVTLIGAAGDPRLEASRIDQAYLGHPGGPAVEGIRQALADAGFELDAAGASVALATAAADSAASARTAARAAEKAGAALIVTDLPADWTLAVADGVQVPVLNVGAPEESLREQDCRPRLYHLLPSERMRTDALAQALVARKWSQVLLLVGPGPQDRQRAATAEASLKRYGLKVVASRPFKLSTDPRERDVGNPALLTAGIGYDAVWVVDSDGEFARALPYRTILPRPVVGDAGLVALAWQAHYERYGAPQVSRRFLKATHRPMTDHDWAAWVAGRSLVALGVGLPKGASRVSPADLAALRIDGSKGTGLSFRAWDGQLRQPMLLTDGQGVIAQAPIDGLLHPSDVLDTLGADEPEKLCKVTR